MYIVAADFRVCLCLCTDNRNYYYRLKKYVNTTSSEVHVTIDYYDNEILSTDIYSYLVENNKLVRLEFLYNGRISHADSSTITCTDMITQNCIDILPSRYGDTMSKYEMYIRDRDIASCNQEWLHELKTTMKTVKQFTEEFNNIGDDYLSLNSIKQCEDNQCDRLQTLETALKELKLDINVQVPTVHNKVDKLEKELARFIELSKGTVDKHKTRMSNFHKRLCDHVAVSNNNFRELKQYMEKADQFKNKIMSKMETLYSLYEEDDSVSKQSDDDHICSLTPDNLLQEAVMFVKSSENHIACDIIDIIKSMLSSSRYILSDDFTKTKLDLKNIQFKFKMLTVPENISRDEVLAEVFNIDHSISLI